MPHSFPGPSFNLSRASTPGADEWADYLARVARPAPMSAEMVANVLAAEAVILGRPARTPAASTATTNGAAMNGAAMNGGATNGGATNGG